MNKKKIIKSVMMVLLTANLAVVLFFVVIPRVFAATGCFDDTDGHIFETYICWLADNGITGGCGGGNFCPGDSVTRGQMSVFIKRVYDLAEAHDDDTLGDLSCSTDQIAKWDGSAWVCEPLSNYYTRSEVDALLADMDSRVAALETKLASVTVSGDDLYFTEVNVHIRDGSGNTEGAVNGLGNLIIGYNEDIGGDATRTGSHNLVVGKNHSYSSYAGFVAGLSNTISGPYASVSGGDFNTASGTASSVTAGYGNEAVGWYSTVAGGKFNTASGYFSSVLGGGGPPTSAGNEAWSDFSVVVGGQDNLTGYIAGGDRTVGEASVILGGYLNRATADLASISGGTLNTASGLYASVSGGVDNTAAGESSTIGGGANDMVTGGADWRAGDLFEDN